VEYIVVDLSEKLTITRRIMKDGDLPEKQRRVLHEIAVHVQQVAGGPSHRRGTVVLFYGSHSTGQTLAAQTLAGELGLDLYRVDLSEVVSKYIGETEKNLQRVFEAAEEAGAILLFDEADALFGKRTKVKDSHDRYANVEINYLLQKLESYGGLTILTTNTKESIDTAFLRRIGFIIEFPLPDAAK
jgi:SpoVK/Ycf46/Vps4 family AAA+-type ATPase